MFYIEKISLTHFKNYEGFQMDFHPKLNCIVGFNGMGKTNLLDAIYYLAFTKSAFHSTDAQLIHHNADAAFVNGTFIHNTSNNFISFGIEKRKKKQFLVNKKPLERISDHIGNLPIVMVSPYDTDLIRDGSESRRKFFDGIISQLSSEYLDALLTYKQLLKHRNSLLKAYIETGRLNKDLLQVITLQMNDPAAIIMKHRGTFLAEFTPLFTHNYEQLTANAERVEVQYHASFSDTDFDAECALHEQKDMRSGRTSAGPHKDDFEFLFNGTSVHKYGSQGQQKSFIIALKLAQYDILHKQKGMKPILMMDDFFDRIDENRITQFSKMIHEERFGQIFITDSHEKRIKEVMNQKELKVIKIG